ncbi:hypothetical protein [Anatilimnocola aggregata]|nr:hypothetical protein [Anatilimnocola aggregata]
MNLAPLLYNDLVATGVNLAGLHHHSGEFCELAVEATSHFTVHCDVTSRI